MTIFYDKILWKFQIKILGYIQKLIVFEIFNFQVEVVMTFDLYDNYGFN